MSDNKQPPNMFVSFFNTVQKEVNQNAHDKGFYDTSIQALIDCDNVAVDRSELKLLSASQRIALMHSELSEGLEGLRHGNPPSDHIPEFTAIEEELADVVIRAMDASQEHGWRLAEAIVAKAAYNGQRSYRHGGKKF